MTAELKLPATLRVFERGWLSANNVLFIDDTQTVLVDSGYGLHAPQTMALLKHALQGRPLDWLVNTHCHSDHMGGNAAIQRQQGQVGVWRLGAAGTPEFAPVQLGMDSLDGRVQVLKGLQTGDTIVVYSQAALTAQTRVQVVDALAKTTRQVPPGDAP